MSGKGMDYYQKMGLDKYDFSQDDQKEICAFYEFSQSDEGRNLLIQPISKENFDAMEYMKEFLPDVCLLWYDGGSNYGGVYVSGLLHGKVMLLSHEEPNYAPLFRNVSKFLERVKNRDIEELCNVRLGECDYPAKNQSPQEKEQDFKMAKQFLDSLMDIDDEDAYYQTALKACYLMPAEHLNLLIPLLQSGNMYVEQDVPDIFVFHTYKAAIPALCDALENGSIHAKSSAKRALAKLRRPAAK